MPTNIDYLRCAYCGAQLHLGSKKQNDAHAICVKWRRRHELKCCIRSPLERRIWAEKYVSNRAPTGGITVNIGHPGFYCDVAPVDEEADVVEALTNLIHYD